VRVIAQELLSGAISTTHNSLKSQRPRNLKSPFSNNRAVTSASENLHMRRHHARSSSHVDNRVICSESCRRDVPSPAFLAVAFMLSAVFN
jgi:hypothetical protein